MTIQSSQSQPVAVELVDMSNCTEASDGICDTPPDYGFGQSCGCCQMRWDVWDRNGDKIEPMMNNVMSYSNGCNGYEFTEQQVAAMIADYESADRTYLRNADVDSYTPIMTETNVIGPSGDVAEYNGILFEWEPTENAEEYIVEIVGGPEKLEYVTSDTELFVTELEPNGLYIWTVQAISKFGGGCQPAQTRIINTGSDLSSVNELDFVNELNIYPNPVTSGQNLNITFDAKRNTEAQVQIFNIAGKLVFDNSIDIQTGNNNINIPTLQLNSGIHLLEIETAEGIITEKIIIE